MQILLSVGNEDGVVDATEFNDLKTLVADASIFHIPGYVGASLDTWSTATWPMPTTKGNPWETSAPAVPPRFFMISLTNGSWEPITQP